MSWIGCSMHPIPRSNCVSKCKKRYSAHAGYQNSFPGKPQISYVYSCQFLPMRAIFCSLCVYLYTRRNPYNCRMSFSKHSYSTRYHLPQSFATALLYGHPLCSRDRWIVAPTCASHLDVVFPIRRKPWAADIMDTESNYLKFHRLLLHAWCFIFAGNWLRKWVLPSSPPVYN